MSQDEKDASISTGAGERPRRGGGIFAFAFAFCMWFILTFLCVLAAVVFVAAIRNLVLAAVERVSTREPRTLAELRFIVHLLHGDPEKVRLVTTKDRSAPSGRRGAIKMAKAKASEAQRKKEALETIRKRMGHRLAERRKERQKSSGRLWDYFGWKNS